MDGVAINIDENVPEITPIIKARDNPDKFSPPKPFNCEIIKVKMKKLLNVKHNLSNIDLFRKPSITSLHIYIAVYLFTFFNTSVTPAAPLMM